MRQEVPPYEKHAKKQWNDNVLAAQLKDLFKDILPTLPEVAREKLKTAILGLVQTPEASKPSSWRSSRISTR